MSSHFWYVLIIQYHVPSRLTDHHYYKSYRHHWHQREKKLSVLKGKNRNREFISPAPFWHQFGETRRNARLTDGAAWQLLSIHRFLKLDYSAWAPVQHRTWMTPTRAKALRHQQTCWCTCWANETISGPLNPSRFHKCVHACLEKKREDLQLCNKIMTAARTLQSMTGGFLLTWYNKKFSLLTQPVQRVNRNHSWA